MKELKKALGNILSASAFVAMASSANAVATNKYIIIEKLCQDSAVANCESSLSETFTFVVRSGGSSEENIEVTLPSAQGMAEVQVTGFQSPSFEKYSFVFEDFPLPEGWEFVGASAVVNSAPQLGTTAACGMEVSGQAGNFTGCRIDWADADNPELYEAVTLTYINSPVPLPASAWMLGSALLGLAGVARRRRS